MVNIVEEQKKRIRYMYTHMFRRYRANTLADGGTVKDDSITMDYLKMAQNNRMDKSIRFGWLGEAGSKIESGRVSKLYDINCFEQLGSELVTNGDFSNGSTNWVIQSGWKIFNGYIISNGMGNINCNANFVSGRRYKISYNLSNNTGGVRVGSNLVYFDTANTTSGLYSVIVNYAGGDGRFYFSQMNNNGISTISNVSIKEVLNATNTNNATQATPTLRPYLTGNIAPNEKLGLKNPNGGSNFMTHPIISFAANESWSVTTVLNWNGNSTETRIASGTNSFIGLRGDGIYDYFIVRNESNNTPVSSIKAYSNINKITIYTYVAAGNGTVKLYINGILVHTFSVASNFEFKNILSTSFSASCKLHAHIIRSQALNQQQVTAEYDYLRSVYPEIESVQIGTQTWATSNCEVAATPMGNVIAEMQANGNVERITNIADREFSSDTGFWIKSQPISGAISISDGVARINSIDGSGCSLQKNILIVGKWYKYSFDIIGTPTGSGQFGDVAVILVINNTTTGTKTGYFKADSTNITFKRASACDYTIDNISVQEIGWSGSQELYDGIYAQTAGTVEQKTYAACKAAGFWRNCQTTVDSGALYGKEYNKFAGILLKMDIDYYNLANPTTPWGYRVPLRADLTTLAAYGGNALKLSGNTYWNTANGTNATGFSALGSGIVNADGTNSALKANTYLLCSDANFARELKDGDDTCNEVAITTQGGVIRLIKV